MRKKESSATLILGMLLRTTLGLLFHEGLRSLTGCQSSMDIDMIRVIRRDPRSPIVSVFPPGSLQTRKMPPRRGARRGGGRGGRGVGRGQPEEQPAVSTADPNAPVTQANLAAMEQRYQNMLQAALAPFLAAQQNQAAPV
ncbi:uncharacterized protein E5676_scaffold2137G00280 [Cucumis melo var. makuwa]|uniref:Gag protease polyprotein n=1 Tax=Cucumis melo var. makuwa TaxID=1194695 RepID=A0A5A7SRM9_CUCMM|nr:uncharacterized protein E6C27_scaffold269G002220 [Cucumis melo var. makuwa]TYK04649.1 uncharacterized protein E5676_scaffold2137G00280 [Cucumis melo var. makuwa]